MKKKIEHIIKKVLPGSIAEELEIEPGDKLLAISGTEIEDIFDYSICNLSQNETKDLLDGKIVKVNQNNGQYFIKYDNILIGIGSVQDSILKLKTYLREDL